MSGTVLKHEAPRLCRIRRALFGASPSAILGRCTFGLRHGCRACKGCEHNVAEAWQEGFAEGLGEEIDVKKLKESVQPAGIDLDKLEAPGVYRVTPPEPEKKLTREEALDRLVGASAVFVQVVHDYVANVVQALVPAIEYYTEIVGEALRKLFENEARTPPRVNKRPDYSQKAKDDTRGKIKRIRTQRSREKK